MTTHGDATETLSDPDFDAAGDLVERGIDAGALVTLFGRCRVDYDGRATSTLGPGDRHVMLKPDGAALVHTDEGQQPVNWQPPGCAHAVRVVEGEFVVESERSSPDELLSIAFESLAHVGVFDVTDPTDLSLTGTEADLRERILDDPDLLEPAFTPLATERSTPAGAIDIYGEDADGRTVVVELKRRRVGPDAVGQLDRYVQALGRDLHDEAEIRGILVAPSVTDRARELLAQKGLEFVSLAPPEN
ncbi:endonuclease NucS [Halomicrobium sp. LC1Hm]|uniref:endonuclease NucS n=1 Tax=Halomicrobium sp. LC1Hm TaxID=2610902 RepID=UPI001298267E|nr:endonuclease NucS [Halomicrobium sp. LC1Hm]QGA84166.1 RecB family endonuclease [Halomicrobium sp. LC1Hm]